MLANFDSDSESDAQNTGKSHSISKPDTTKQSSFSESRRVNQLNDSADDSDDDDDIVRPKGRLAARMRGDRGNSESHQETASSRLSKALRKEKEQAQKPQKSPVPENDSDEDLPAARPIRRNGRTQQSPSPSDDESRRSLSRARTTSPLFVSSPGAHHDGPNHESNAEEETEERPKSNARFLALVAQKREEREERERIEAEKQAARRAQMEQFSSEVLSGEESELDDPGSAQNLTQKARQPRKASKKALEEMSRETQRLSRNMQLAHQAQTKKKITKESLFARFNFMQPDISSTEPPAANSSSTAGSQHSSDGENNHKNNDTPQTSPVLGPSDASRPVSTDKPTQPQPELGNGLDTDEAPIPSLDKANATTQGVSKASGGAPTSDDAKLEAAVGKQTKGPRTLTQRPVRVLMTREEIARHQKDGSDSDDLEVVTSPAKCRRIAAFENLPSRRMQESSSTTKLKALAHLTSPNRKSTMTSAELSASLLYKARQQAAKDRRERIEELRAQGVLIETTDDRAAMEDEIEDLVEKARKEAEEIARKERGSKKKEHGDDYNEADDEDDFDYAFSGSDEDASDNDEGDDSKIIEDNQGFVEQEAHESDESEDDHTEHELSDVNGEASEKGRKRRTRVVSDDEDEEEQPQVPSTPVRPPSNAPQSIERPHFPGLESPDNPSIGLTQAFAGTMADDESVSQPGSATLPFSLPDPGQPVPMLRAQESEILVRDSQDQSNEPDFLTGPSQNVARVSESPAAHHFSQYSQLPDPTQDEGFVFSPFDPAKRFRGTPPVSTVDTVLVGQSQSPAAERKRKQLRRGRQGKLSAVEEEDNEGDFEVNADAFNVMKKAAKKPDAPYDKKKSRAKDIVDEAAEESEDEYAGIGGASDDSEGEEDAYDQQMINDQSGEVVDEKQLAALNASVHPSLHTQLLVC